MISVKRFLLLSSLVFLGSATSSFNSNGSEKITVLFSDDFESGINRWKFWDGERQSKEGQSITSQTRHAGKYALSGETTKGNVDHLIDVDFWESNSFIRFWYFASETDQVRMIHICLRSRTDEETYRLSLSPIRLDKWQEVVVRLLDISPQLEGDRISQIEINAFTKEGAFIIDDVLVYSLPANVRRQTGKSIEAEEWRHSEIGEQSVSRGLFVDRNGNSHEWYVNDSHTLIWDGEPYIPIGGMYEANRLEHLDFLPQLKRMGVDDVYFNPVRRITGTSATELQAILDTAEQLGFKYGLELTDGPTKGLSGCLVGNHEIRRIQSKSSHRMKITFGKLIDRLDKVVYVLVDEETGRGVQKGYAEFSQVRRSRDKLVAEVEVSLPNSSGRYSILLTPLVQARCSNSGQVNDLWTYYDEYKRRIQRFLRSLQFGEGFRFIVDPFSNESGFRRELRPFVPNGQAYRRQFVKCLADRYGHDIGRLRRAWAVDDGIRITSFQHASELIPVIGAEDRGYLFDPVTRNLIAINSKSVLRDHFRFRDTSLRNFYKRITCDIKQVVDIPVIFKCTEMTESLIPSQDGRGFDGIGAEAYGSGISPIVSNAGHTYSLMEQSPKTMWAVVTETGHREPGRKKLINGYPSMEVMHSDFDRFFQMGFKGIFVWLLHTVLDIDWYKQYDLSEVPEQIGWLAEYERRMRVAEIDDYKPEPWYLFPPISSPTELKGRWVLPTYSPSVETNTLIVFSEDLPEAGHELGELNRLIEKSQTRIFFLGIRNNLGQIPSLDRYFTTETEYQDDIGLVQILRSTGSSMPLFQKDGKVWALQDFNLFIIAKRGCPLEFLESVAF